MPTTSLYWSIVGRLTILLVSIWPTCCDYRWCQQKSSPFGLPMENMSDARGGLRRYKWIFRALFFLNSLLLTFHRVGRSVGDLMARVTWLCGLRLETFDHGIFVGKPYQKIAWYRRARHPSSIIKGVIQGNLPKPSVVCIMFPRSLKRNHKGIFIQACRKYCKNFLICS